MTLLLEAIIGVLKLILWHLVRQNDGEAAEELKSYEGILDAA